MIFLIFEKNICVCRKLNRTTQIREAPCYRRGRSALTSTKKNFWKRKKYFFAPDSMAFFDTLDDLDGSYLRIKIRVEVL